MEHRVRSYSRSDCSSSVHRIHVPGDSRTPKHSVQATPHARVCGGLPIHSVLPPRTSEVKHRRSFSMNFDRAANS